MTDESKQEEKDEIFVESSLENAEDWANRQHMCGFRDLAPDVKSAYLKDVLESIIDELNDAAKTASKRVRTMNIGFQRAGTD